MRLADYRTRPLAIPPDLLNAPAPSRPRSVFRQRVQSMRLFLAIGGLVIGLLLAAQWRSGLSSAQSNSRTATRQQINTSIVELEQEQANLKQQIGSLRNQINAVREKNTQASTTLDQINNTWQEAQRSAGLMPLRGEGVVATFDDSKVSNTAPDATLADYIIHEYDLRDGIAALLDGGAEAISLNGERVVASTSVYCVGSTIIVNSTRLSPPYNISAIGNSNALSESLIKSPQMTKFTQRAKQYGVILGVTSSSDVHVPEYKGEIKLRYGKPLREGR